MGRNGYPSKLTKKKGCFKQTLPSSFLKSRIMKLVFLIASFVGAYVHVGFADARQKRTSLRRDLKKYKQAQDHTKASGDSCFSYYYGDSPMSTVGDFSYPESRTGKSGDCTGKGGTTNPTIPGEGAADASGSNDSTHLERICDLYAEFESSVSSYLVANPCQNFERFEFLMCPKEYTIERICTSSSGVSANLSDDIMNQYCRRFFPENLNSSNGKLCSDLCSAFVNEADCCKVSCP